MLNSNSVAFCTSPPLFTKRHLPYSFASRHHLSTLHRRHIHHPRRDSYRDHGHDYDYDHVLIPPVRHRLRHIQLPAGDVNVTRCMSQTSRYGGASEDTSAQQESQSAAASNLNNSSNTNPNPNPNSNPSDATPVTSTGRLNITKYKSQRSVLSCDKREVTAEEVNALMIKAGKLARDIEKWKKAIKGSYAVVSARLVSGGALVGFARATSDHALNGTIWDVVTDPALPDEPLMKRNVVKYLLKELRRTVPGCSIALFSSVEDRHLFEGLDFVADPDGIRGMALYDPSQQSYL